MGVEIPPILVLIVCKTIAVGAPDENTRFTGAKELAWATEHSMMVCRRNEVQLYDPAEGMRLNPNDDPAPPLNPNFSMQSQCGSRWIGTRATRTASGACGASAARHPSSIRGPVR